ncbi:striatin-interacting protein 1 [Tribolium castaneum]|uniref:Striatin-interacting protein 1-like Protein n=1 Tax=Tribolium castaneum TaxID=7070 RepID=D6W7U6_TRICA|nr:PREDICTED: striatin-interacting protein 1 [Tribolium castaneum]XP_008199465.1 PREDICTED: striatin-interacting protein 1 [Tribolium castaneum]XP_008199466.1 PREDICTED: striatin-interacting protein 1 [Tribolium castaneum]EFA11227.2 Striatin-interacting protein 1-like Protein [Tribolium castaneum]|eukprot:XP_001815164.1 PREDICTED: striatin-interacting protein 1 [Tribolium castaneum]
MDPNGNGKRGLPRLREIIRRQRQDSDGGGTDSPDLDFIYDDTDTHPNEIAELYSYTEQPELALNVKAFEDQMEQYNLPPSWQRLSLEQRKSVVMKLLDQLEVSSKPLRMRAARCILYIAQGCWAEMQSDAEQQQWARVNVMLLYQLGVFSAFTDLLNIEIENSTAAHVAMRKIAVSLADSQDLRVILSVLYTITEVIRNEKYSGSTEYQSDVESFCSDLANSYDDELLIVKLLGMVTRFCSGAAPHFPMKKVLLLLWKLILVTLGGMTVLKDLKDEKREKAGLPRLDEDTMEIAKTMRASSPPASASDLLEAQNQKRNTRPFRRNLMKQSSLDDHESLGMELDATLVGGDNGDELGELSEYDDRRPPENSENNQMYSNYQNRPTSPPLQSSLVVPRGLPWKPKVRQKDIDLFLDTARLKFVGYSLQGDRDSLAGLPLPIHEGVKTLKEHVYTSLAELQIQKEEEIARNPLSTSEGEIEMTPTEILYQAMLPNLPQYMIALLKILLAAAPTSKAKTDSINIMADVLPEEMPMTVLQSMKLGIDVNRHKEIIVKAVSAILLLLLKHFKLNHIYQFEFMSQHLVFANCIPLVLKFFNQNIMAYVGAKNVIPILDFPSCVIGDQPELTAESLEIGDSAPFSWRNMFSCINLLRILNKLTKWKHSRIMMLVVFKSAPILKRTLKVRHAMTQLYVLKLLKMQTKYLGRQWRKSNMKTISAIYQKVRHRLNDDWAYGNDLDARPWDFQAEECALRASVDRFNNRRYTQANQDSEFAPVDNCLNSVLGTTYDLSESFKQHYQLWLEQEVYGNTIEWEELLLNQTI